MGRAPCCDKANVKKGPWSPEEDTKLKSYIEQHGNGGNWIALPQKIGLKRCGKSCRLRWLNYLRPNLKHGGFSEEEDNIICNLYISIGSRWSIIASQLPGRTDNDVKNYWNTRLKKKLLGKQRKEPQSARRAAAGHPKQEAKGDEDGNLGVGGGGTSRITDWPHQPGLVYPIDHAYHRIGADEQALMREPLVELGGTDGANHGNSPFIMPSTVSQQQIFINDPICSVSSSLQEQNPAGCLALQCTNVFSTELDYILRFNPTKMEGTEAGCFCGTGGTVVDEDNPTSRLENMMINWNEVSPSVYPSMVRSYEGTQQSFM